MQTPAVGDLAQFQSEGKITRIEGDNAYVTVASINGKPVTPGGGSSHTTRPNRMPTTNLNFLDQVVLDFGELLDTAVLFAQMVQKPVLLFGDAVHPPKHTAQQPVPRRPIQKAAEFLSIGDAVRRGVGLAGTCRYKETDRVAA